jgi:hypothetical protein
MKKYLSGIFMAGTLLVLAGAMMYALHSFHEKAPFVFTAGAIIVAICQCFIPYNDATVSLRRLHRQQLFGGVMLIATGVVMFLLPGTTWVLCLTFAAILELYAAYRIPYLEKKEKGKGRNKLS